MMATSIRLSLKSDDAGYLSTIVLLVALTTLHQLTVIRGSSVDNFVLASEGPVKTPAAELSSPLSSIVNGTIDASTSVNPSKVPSHSELDPDLLVSSSSSADRKEITHNRIRTKRNWKTNRVQAAWGKRADGDGGVDEVLTSLLKVPDTRLRRKWTQMGRQAWGKRSFDSATASHLSDETALDKSDRIDDSGDDDVEASEQSDSSRSLTATSELIIPGRVARKWGVGSAKAAWGKRKWGASNDMRVWGKRSLGDDAGDGVGDDKDDVAELQGNRLSRSRRSAFDGELARQRLRGDQWLPRAAVQAVAAKRLRMSGVIPAVMGAGRVYVGPKRNWQTNTMKVWGKRSDYNNDDDDVNFPEYAFDDADGGHQDDNSSNVWNGIGDDGREAARKRAWSSDNSLRIWGKRFRLAAAAPTDAQVDGDDTAY